MNRANGVGDGTLGVSADFQCGLHRSLQIANIIHRIKDPEHIHTVLMRTLHKAGHHIIGVMPVPQQILSTQ